MCLHWEQIEPNRQKTGIFFILETFFCPSCRFLSVSTKAKNLNFGQPSLYLTHCGNSRSGEPRLMLADWQRISKCRLLVVGGPKQSCLGFFFKCCLLMLGAPTHGCLGVFSKCCPVVVGGPKKGCCNDYRTAKGSYVCAYFLTSAGVLCHLKEKCKYCRTW
jgi:hypothetical protein